MFRLVSVHLQEEPDSILFITSHYPVVDSNKVPPLPPLLQAEQGHLPQPCPDQPGNFAPLAPMCP